LADSIAVELSVGSIQHQAEAVAATILRQAAHQYPVCPPVICISGISGSPSARGHIHCCRSAAQLPHCQGPSYPRQAAAAAEAHDSNEKQPCAPFTNMILSELHVEVVDQQQPC
jgi:hypothetical protein